MRIILIRLSAAFVLIFLLAGQISAQEPNETNAVAPIYKKVEIPKYPSPKLITLPPEKLFSPTASQLFYEMAYELARQDEISESQIEQAIVLLNAAMELDVSSGFAASDMLAILSRPGPARHLQLLYDSLIKYVKKDADCLIASNAIGYLLEQLDTRQQREQLLGRLIRDVGESNPAIKSNLATELGIMYAEKADDANAAKTLAFAYSWNRYNQLAYEKLLELVPDQISPVSNLEFLRLKIRANPLDIDSAIAYAQYARKIGLYEIAAGAYQYSSDLFKFLFPNQQFPTIFYTEWMTSLYNTPRSRPKCLQLADDFRKQGRFDLQIEVIAARAAETTGDAATAADILKAAEQKALSSDQTDYKSLAWFYCFILPDPNKALDYANKAYSNEPNSPDAAGLLACAFADNNQLALAKPLLDNYPQTQFASYAHAKIYLAVNNKQSAIDAFRTTIDKDPGSIVAEKAMLALIQQGADYIPVFDTNLITASLQSSVGEQLVPQFLTPDRIISFGLNVRGNRFSYGNDITAAISITNNGFEPLVISENALCKGRITIDAEVSGDIQARFENLISITSRPAEPLLPGRSHIVGTRLNTGKLRDLLLQHPQAELKIRFTAWLDPITNGEEETVSSIPGVKPAIIEIERPRVEVTTDFIQNRFNSLTKGKQGPRVKAAQLFAGLMMESALAGKSRPQQSISSSYKPITGAWLDTMIKSALVMGLTDSDWVVKVHTMAAIEPLDLDYELINACSQGLNDKNWPARMMAVKLLAEKQPESFAKVLDYKAQYDENAFVRDMAIALGAKIPEPNQPLEQPFLKTLLGEPNSQSQ